MQANLTNNVEAQTAIVRQIRLGIFDPDIFRLTFSLLFVMFRFT